jgi:AGZA family xanthine/uracil permease-like MFS transporter
MKTITNYFDIKKLGSNIRTEILAGLSIFLSLSYIFVVNPAILAETGIDKSAVFFATIIVSALATIVMGIYAKKPFALAPGLEMNSYIAFVVVAGMGFVWQEALGLVFWSGILMVIVNAFKIRKSIIQAIPNTLKAGLASTVGVFLMLIALNVSGVLAYEGIQLTGIGDLVAPGALVFLVGLLTVIILKKFKVKGAIMISIALASVVGHLTGLADAIEPVRMSSDMFSAFFALDFSVILNPKALSVILILFLLDFYGSIAKFIGLTRNTNIVDENGDMPQMQEALSVDGGSTVIGSVLGTSNVTTYVESAVGIGEGGRIGLTAVTTGILMLLFLLLTPLVNLVPVIATTGALFYVGYTLFPRKEELLKYRWFDIVSVLAMVITTIFTFGLDKSMLIGFCLYIVFQIFSGKWKQVNPYLLGSTVLLLLAIFL